MTTSILIAASTVVTMFQLFQPIWSRTDVRLRERLRILVSLVLALAVVALATLGYLELVATLLESIE